MSKLTRYKIERPIRHGGELQREGTIELTDKVAKPLLECGAVSVIKGAVQKVAPSAGDKGDGKETGGAPDQNNPNRSPAPTEAAERLLLIKAAITQMKTKKVDADWTNESGPKLKPLADAVGFEVSVEERNQAFAELYPEKQK